VGYRGQKRLLKWCDHCSSNPMGSLPALLFLLISYSGYDFGFSATSGNPHILLSRVPTFGRNLD
jgi:hypothetical protein